MATTESEKLLRDAGVGSLDGTVPHTVESAGTPPYRTGLASDGSRIAPSTRGMTPTQTRALLMLLIARSIRYADIVEMGPAMMRAFRDLERRGLSSWNRKATSFELSV